MPVKRVDALQFLNEHGYAAMQSHTPSRGSEYLVGSYVLFEKKSGKIEVCYHYNKDVSHEDAFKKFQNAAINLARKYA